VIAIVDYDIGNLAAVSNMLARIGVPSVISSDASQIAAASGIILPGNGHFDSCMRGLNASGLRPILERRVLEDRVPLLGICVGAQMLGLRSEEGTEPGLGWLQMRVDRFPKLEDLRVPHMGWNHVTPARNGHPLLANLPEDARFYFVHSYYLNPADPLDRMLDCNYGIDFAAGVARDNIVGVQFHPEKSHRFGKILLGNFAELVA
jgi:imidazole glycerol-phosphate synthase subunit HisH